MVRTMESHLHHGSSKHNELWTNRSISAVQPGVNLYIKLSSGIEFRSTSRFLWFLFSFDRLLQINDTINSYWNQRRFRLILSIVLTGCILKSNKTSVISTMKYIYTRLIVFKVQFYNNPMKDYCMKAFPLFPLILMTKCVLWNKHWKWVPYGLPIKYRITGGSVNLVWFTV